jgi:oxygen-independent coproporphyrinogen III oxidase
MTNLKQNPKSKSLYIHIPFCNHLCHYCDFTKMIYVSSLTDDYLNMLFEEINNYHIGSMDTIYIGGGTPTSLNINQLKRLLQFVQPLTNEHSELTVEVNVENASSEKLQLLHYYGVNRLSIGVETFNDYHLKKLNRYHDKKKAQQVIKLAKDIGFLNISIDLLHDLPFANEKDLFDDLRQVILLDVDHISTYALSIVPHTVLYINKQRPIVEEQAASNYQMIVNFLRKHGYKRYEVSNFARNNKYSRHNLTYWQNRDYYGVGLAAAGYIDGVRYQNTRSMSKYLKGHFVASKEVITEEQYLLEYIMLGLRMEEGLFENDFVKRFGYSFIKRFEENIKKLIDDDLLIDDNGQYRLTDKGFLLLDTVVIKLLSD